MSSPQDPLSNPFDLITTGQEMDNVVPFLAPNKVDLMIKAALAQPQVAVKKPAQLTKWKYGGLAIAASLAFFMVFLSPAETPVMNGDAPSLSAALTQTSASAEDINEFSELVMLENLERF